MSGAAIGWARALAVLVVTFAIDQATKAIALASLRPGEPHAIFLGLELRLVRNRGVAFGALAGVDGAAIAALTAVALLALLAHFARRPGAPLLWLPVGIVLGGAAGNLVDRVRHGAVTDFVDPPYWPAFNVADTAIVLGILGVLYVSERRGARQGAGDPPPGDDRLGSGEPRPRDDRVGSGEPRPREDPVGSGKQCPRGS